jgi:hypothetical protein
MTKKEYVEGLLKAAPEEKRAAILASLEEAGVVDLVADGVMLKADYSRNFDQLKANREALNTWYEDTRGLLQQGSAAMSELERMRAATAQRGAGAENDNPEGTGNPNPPPSLDVKKLLAEGYISKEEAARALQANNQSMLAVTAAISSLQFQHKDRFGKVFDPASLLKYAADHGVGTVEGAYNAMFAKELEEHAAKVEGDARKAFEDKVRKEVTAEIMKKQGGILPMTSEEPLSPTLGGMRDAKDKSFGIDAAVSAYNERTAEATN